MSTVDDVFTQALALPIPQRAALAQQLLHSLEPDDPDAEDAWAEEILARSDKVHSGSYVAHDWREAIDDIRSRLRRS
jgi:putative addiction module component (TIGR02574 family)